MKKQELESELKNGTSFEFTNQFEDLIETQFSRIRGNKFLIKKNGKLIKSTESFTNFFISLGIHNLILTDKF